jgi:hypothetical protein
MLDVFFNESSDGKNKKRIGRYPRQSAGKFIAKYCAAVRLA